MGNELPVIGFDIDGVLADFVRGFTEYVRQEHGTEVFSGGGQPEWSFAEKLGLTQEEEGKIWDELWAHPRFWSSLETTISYGEMADLLDLEHDALCRFVYITSRRGDNAYQQTRAWLDYHGFPAGDLIMSPDKVAILKEMDCILFLEDSPKHIEDMLWARLPVIRRDWPYNRFGARPPYVSSVSEFVSIARDTLARVAIERARAT